MDIRLATLVLTALLASAQARAEDPVKAPVGSALVHGESLKPYENSWRMQITAKGGTSPRNAGIWRDRFEVIDIAGKSYGIRLQDASFLNAAGEVAATTKTLNVFDRATMAPVTRAYERHVSGKADSITRIAFAARQLKLDKFDDGKSISVKRKVEPAFDFDGGLYALLWSAFPLKVGFSASLPSYAEDEHVGNVQWRSFRVTGSERIDAGRLGAKDCWVVEGDSGSGPLKYWLIADPPYIVQLEFEQAGTGAKWRLTMT